MFKRLLLSLTLLLSTVAVSLGAYPYDSVAEILVQEGNQYAGGSATLIAVTNEQALLLTCSHVAMQVGKGVKINWTATGEQAMGKVIRIAPNGLDAALIICSRPKGLRAIPVAPIDITITETIVNAGYPGVTGTLEWQRGDVQSLDSDTLWYSCRPVPGMSGGATFDQYGNLVGVIQFYTLDGGGSTSGRDLLFFLKRYILETQVSWVADFPQYEVLLLAAPEETNVNGPEPFDVFLQFIRDEYNSGPLAYGVDIQPLPETKDDAVGPGDDLVD